MKPLTVREWLEHERLTGLPHADFAADSLLAIAERDEMAEGDEAWRDDVNRETGDVVTSSDQIVECFKFRAAILTALNDAGVADGDVTGDQAAGLLRMFLPC